MLGSRMLAELKVPQLTKSAGRRAPTPASAVSIVVVTGPDAGQRLELTQGSAIIGSQQGCDLLLTDETVSRQHLKIELGASGVKAIDLKSRNGVFIDGARITEATVPLGTRLMLGDTELRIDALGASPRATTADTEFHGLVGASGAMREVMWTLKSVAPTDSTVLISGETGAGKDVAARAIHSASGRKGELVVFDCGAAAPGVIASELFGHVRGAFTDARSDRSGAVVDADGGTLFLDEIGELDLSLQPALLRLLETREVKPLGGGRTRKVDVRVIAATNRDLHHEVDAGRFRKDLLFRLAVFSVTLPPLRARLDDVGVLASRVLHEAGKSLDLNEDALAILRSYAWPGNVRELKNVLLRMVTLGGAPDIGAAPPKERGVEYRPAVSPPRPAPDDLPPEFSKARESMISRFEQAYLKDLLEKSNGNLSLAARTAGLARGHLYRLIKKHGLER
jgi:two-component system, NtrC family, nitrogen regulation response regulator GlnG